MADHIAAEAGGTLRSLTETGQFHIRRLHLNRPALIAHRIAYRQRLLREEVNERDLAQALSRLSQLEQQVQQLIEQIGRLRG